MPFSDIADLVLGTDYDLSLVFIGDRRSRRLNNNYRQKDKKANILSFPYDENSGEIFLNLAAAKKEFAKKSAEFFSGRKASLPFWLTFLFIHGCLHLKGMDHGVKMELEEQRILKRFSRA